MEKSLIRNFVITAHIDHGKSTLADRLLEITGTIAKDKLLAQHLDQNPIEREWGITIKLAPVRMNYKNHVLNLIDTPGHVDFSYEVSRSLACVEGAILLVDATSGIQAQTISNANLVLDQGLTIIPVVNKIDAQNANPEKTAEDMANTFGFREDEILFISAKTGQNVDQLLEAIVQRIPPPTGEEKDPLKALIFDSQYDPFKGVITYVRVFEGSVTKGEFIHLMGSGEKATVIETGLFIPTRKPVARLSAGETGYIATGLKEIAKARVGDTLTSNVKPTSQAIPGYKEPKPMVFASFYPTDSDDAPLLVEALGKLKLNDAALTFEPDHSDALGAGVRIGFLGLLHMDIVQERIEREYNVSLIASIPTVKYKIETITGDVLYIDRPAKLPEPSMIQSVEEPFVTGTIITPREWIGGIVTLVTSHRGSITTMDYKGNQVFIEIVIPLSEIIVKFYDQLKNVSSGFASFDYEIKGMEPVEVVRLDILVAKRPLDALSQIVVRDRAESIGRQLVEKLKEVIPRQQFEVPIQATIGAKIVARADIAAFRKDVTAKLYGGDVTRKNKLLDKQKKGKKRMKMVGNIEIPQEAFLSVLKI